MPTLSAWTWLSLVLLAAASVPATWAQDYSQDGDCQIDAYSITVQLPPESECSSRCRVGLHISAPAAGQPAAGSSCPQGPYPLVCFFSGFQLPWSYYQPYAARLASWGYAVLQYDLGFLNIVKDRVEVGYLPYLLAQLHGLNSNSSSPLYQRLDLQQLAAAGHSRGAKLAALHLAGSALVKTAYLIDPVDSTSFTPSSPDYPSAVEALRWLNKTAAVTGAGISGPCNPTSSNYAAFWAVLGSGSWLEMVPKAGHVQFADVWNSAVKFVLDRLCHSGAGLGHPEAISLAAAPLVAWMERTFRTPQEVSSSGSLGVSSIAAPAASTPGGGAAAASVSAAPGMWHHHHADPADGATWQEVGAAAPGAKQQQLAHPAMLRKLLRWELQQQQQQQQGSKATGAGAIESGDPVPWRDAGGGAEIKYGEDASSGDRQVSANHREAQLKQAMGLDGCVAGLGREASLGPFFDWVEREEEQGLISFCVKQ